VVAGEGEAIKGVYFAWSGEFEITKAKN